MINNKGKLFSKDNLTVRHKIVFMVAVLFFFALFIAINSLQSFKYSLGYPADSLKDNTAHDIFSSSKTIATASLDNQQVFEPNVSLLGTIVGAPSRAFIAPFNSGRAHLYKVGDSICGAKIISITSGKIMLEKYGIRKEVLLDKSRKGFDQTGNIISI